MDKYFVSVHFFIRSNLFNVLYIMENNKGDISYLKQSAILAEEADTSDAVDHLIYMYENQ